MKARKVGYSLHTFQNYCDRRQAVRLYAAAMNSPLPPPRPPPKVSVFSRIRRSFRRKRESYCINCGHVTKACYHNKDVYENVEFGNNGKDATAAKEEMMSKEELLKWLDLDYAADASVQHRQNNNKVIKGRVQIKIYFYRWVPATSILRN